MICNLFRPGITFRNKKALVAGQHFKLNFNVWHFQRRLEKNLSCSRKNEAFNKRSFYQYRLQKYTFFTRTSKELNFLLTFIIHQPHADAFKSVAFLNRHYFFPLICIVFSPFYLLHQFKKFLCLSLRTRVFTVMEKLCGLFCINKISEQTR